jgi:hypothetical protein
MSIMRMHVHWWVSVREWLWWLLLVVRLRHWGWRKQLEVGDMRRHDFSLPFLLQICEDILVYAVLVEFGLNGVNNIVYD